MEPLALLSDPKYYLHLMPATTPLEMCFFALTTLSAYNMVGVHWEGWEGDLEAGNRKKCRTANKYSEKGPGLDLNITGYLKEGHSSHCGRKVV